ncbi:MAG: serine hydrolase [Candidatus Aminicenantes bacterium]|jgi:CubicO group peptidase (beta-lactamase class C family)
MSKKAFILIKNVSIQRAPKTFLLLLLVAAGLSFIWQPVSRADHAQTSKKTCYFPGRADCWETRKPEDLGMDSKRLKEAVDFAQSNGWTGPKDLKISITQAFSREPYGEILGPTKERGETNGILIKDGYIVAEWGDTKRVDMTFSVTKSYLSTIAGLALDDGLIFDVHDKVKTYVVDGKFDSEHNAKIEWHHLLNQTSDWSGTLWDKPDWSDRPPRGVKWEALRNRPLKEPGSSYKYNDVRVNLLAFCLLQVWRKPLPMVLRERIMDPIGASSTWRWFGYRNSWVLVDGVKIQSVSGGGHWGGGFFINTRDQARFGLLFLRRGNWNGKQLISERWIDMLRVPTPANTNYGYMWWLNTGRKQIPSAPETVYYAAGFGGNYIVVDEGHELVVVVRWVGNTRVLDGIIQRILASIDEKN